MKKSNLIRVPMNIGDITDDRAHTFVYDQIAAEKFIAERTGQSLATVRTFLETLWDFDESQPAIKDHTLSLMHVCRMTGLSRSAVASMYAEDVAYMVTRDIMDADAYPYFRSWADGIAQEEQEKGNADIVVGGVQ